MVETHDVDIVRTRTEARRTSITFLVFILSWGKHAFVGRLSGVWTQAEGVVSESNIKLLLWLQKDYIPTKFKVNDVFVQEISYLYFLSIWWDMKKKNLVTTLPQAFLRITHALTLEDWWYIALIVYSQLRRCLCNPNSNVWNVTKKIEAPKGCRVWLVILNAGRIWT
jgi:hypothetical protein